MKKLLVFAMGLLIAGALTVSAAEGKGKKADTPEQAKLRKEMVEKYDANKDGKIVCFFQTAQKFKTRYSTFGFNDSANLDEGEMWPVAFALKKLTATEEAKITALVKKAAS